MSWVALALGAAALALAWTETASAKSPGLQSPRGRQIYDVQETFGTVRDQNQRTFVVEVVSGIAPEGNLGLLLGVINQPVPHLEFYVGVAGELTPARSFPFSARYMFNFDGYRPYVSAGYVFRTLAETGLVSHNVFFEAGHKWILHHTHHLTLGLGLRRPLHVVVLGSSPLNDDDVDRTLLSEHLDASPAWVPSLALRFSRAF